MSARAHALTANRLSDGVVVFWCLDGWAEQFADARLFESQEEAEAALAAAKARPTLLVDPYLVEVALTEDGAAPVSYRERVRALGPTIHPDMGKQAVGGAAIETLRRAGGAGRSSGRLSLIRRK